jgi:hypothetical protein
MAIHEIKTLDNNVQVRKASHSNEYLLKKINEDFNSKSVSVLVEFGPFKTLDSGFGGYLVGTTLKNFVIWQGEEYLAICDTWTNNDLLQKLDEIIINADSLDNY